MTSTVGLVDGRLAGSLKSNDADIAFDLLLDVPIESDDHGAALSADGGAPGKAYAGCQAALVKRDASALRPFLSEELRQTLAEATKDRKAAAYLN